MSYVYDEDGTLIADTLTGGATTTWGQSARYIYLPTASGPMPVAAIYGTKHYAIQSDHLNTPRRLIQSDGQVAWQWAYSAFGDEQPTIASNRFANVALNQSFGTTSVAAVTFNLRYPGQYFDQESGLHYNYHRSYSAAVGRYTQSDPIDLEGGWNRFGYSNQNPLSNVDPLGLAWTCSTNGLVTTCTNPPPGIPGDGRPPTPNIPPFPGFPLPPVPIVQIISSIIDACTPNPDECKAEWRRAQNVCYEWIQELADPKTPKLRRKQLLDLTGGSMAACQMGQVSQACGGNRVDNPRPKRR